MSVLSANSFSTVSNSSNRGYARGESVIFSQKVLVPLGLSAASVLGAYLLYQYLQNKKDASDTDDMFKVSPNSTTLAKSNSKNNKGPMSLSTSPPPSGIAKNSAQDNDHRRQALDDLMRIIGGVESIGKGAGADDALLFDGNKRKVQKKTPKESEGGGDEDAEDDEDPVAYIDRFFEYVPQPEGFSTVRNYCLAAIEAAIAVLEGRRPKKGKKGVEEDDGFEDEESNPDPVLQVATQIEVDLRHRLAYFAQEFGFSLFKDGEEASGVCATYAGPIPKPKFMDEELSKKVLLEAVKEYLEVCKEIDRTKPIVVDLAKQEAVSGGKGDKDAWKRIGDRDADLDDEETAQVTAGKKGTAKKNTSKYMDSFQDEDDEDVDAQSPTADDDDDEYAIIGKNGKSSNNKEAAIGRMLAAREQRFMGQHAAAKMDEMLQERQMKMVKAANGFKKKAGGAAVGADDEDDDEDDDEEDDLHDDLAFIGEPLHDVNRRAFEAALIRSVLLQISSEDDPLTKPHIPLLNEVAAMYKEPSEHDEEEEAEDYEDDLEDWGLEGDEDDDGDDDYWYGEEDRMRGMMGMGAGGGTGHMMHLMAGRGRAMGADRDGWDDADEDDEWADDYEGDEFDDAEEEAQREMFERMMMMQAARMRGRGRGGKAGPSPAGGGASTTAKTSSTQTKGKGNNNKALQQQQQTRANIDMLLGHANASDYAAMFVDDEDDDEDGIGFDSNDINDPAREAFIRDMIEREAAEYAAMRGAARKKSGQKGKTTAVVEELNDDEDDGEWVDY